MTHDPMALFLTLLPPRARGQLHNTTLVTARVHRAVRDHGWTVEQLVAECTRDTADVRNVAGVITHRLERCAEQPPAAAPAASVRRPFCSTECRENGGWIVDTVGRPLRRCDCRRQPTEVT